MNIRVGISSMFIVETELKPVKALNVSLKPSHNPTLSCATIGSADNAPLLVPRQIPVVIIKCQSLILLFLLVILCDCDLQLWILCERSQSVHWWRISLLLWEQGLSTLLH